MVAALLLSVVEVKAHRSRLKPLLEPLVNFFIWHYYIVY